MSLILSGTDGLSDVDGSAATPAIRGTDANTGMFFPAADTIAFSEGGVEAMRIDGSGNLGIGTTSPDQKLDVRGNGETRIKVSSNDSNPAQIQLITSHSAPNNNNWSISAGFGGTQNLRFANNLVGEAMRIDSSNNLLIGTTTANGLGMTLSGGGTQIITNFPSAYTCASFRTASVQYGFITTSTSGTVFSTSSDYRLKENIAPMTGALDKVAALKPVTYKWKLDGSDGQGFIAHELQEVVPECVTGEKDAVDAEGKPVYQGIDTSFLVATLTAAIQELKATVDAQAVEIAALKAK